MKKISVLILSKNDEDVIKGAIESVGDWGEAIVIDANNNDKIEIIANKLGVRTIKHPFKDFSDQRNFAILHISTPWVLYLDSDERLTPEFKSEVNNVINNYNEKSTIGGYFINRKTFYYGKDWNFTDQVQRLFFKEKFIEWKGTVHETPIIKAEFGSISSPINHFTHRNLSQMVRKTNEWSEFEAKLRFNNKHPEMQPWRFLRVMITEFINSYIKNKGYKNGTYGLIEAIYQSFSIFITYAKLWEMQDRKK